MTHNTKFLFFSLKEKKKRIDFELMFLDLGFLSSRLVVWPD